ncbi:CRISPR-associated protein Cmr3 [Desulfobotulus alkaliphilus]|uniref:CRISPR-associated protein Cmr3 n=1 Tax=Desulfobotulus alkaliphilus TaxID=622671 RepID=A0A562R1B0_9BACT|nr:type III-B CRISPR module-associated Cmr3 family protein [Desulfobotulus alkaliphilus]TWI62865.1 CRISPR-associated protein Cmr3 [Desulfobotulus alkaliphilus]
MTRYMLSSKELLILRDGRPFGDAGSFGGTGLAWPLPQTLAGMCRTALVLAGPEDAFENKENLDALLDVSMEKILPCLIEEGRTIEEAEILLPFPADLLCLEEDDGKKKKICLYPLTYSSHAETEGTDWNDPDWLYPGLSSKGKPQTPPGFLRKKLAQDYLAGSIEVKGRDLDKDTETIDGPVKDIRIHVALDPATRAADEGRLYGESGIYLKAVKARKESGKTTDEKALPGKMPRPEPIGDMGISFSLKGLKPEEKVPGVLYLGGERKRVDLFPVKQETFPEPHAVCENQKFLKLILITHGDFGGWAPEWLAKQTETGAFAWVKEPRSGIEIRLRSAVVTGWEPVSGWDLKEKKPKAFRKLVRPGAVYLVELKTPSESLSLAQALWGQSLCLPESRGEKDGYGQVLVGAAKTIINGKDTE